MALIDVQRRKLRPRLFVLARHVVLVILGRHGQVREEAVKHCSADRGLLTVWKAHGVGLRVATCIGGTVVIVIVQRTVRPGLERRLAGRAWNRGAFSPRGHLKAITSEVQLNASIEGCALFVNRLTHASLAEAPHARSRAAPRSHTHT